ncbi:FAD-binding protein [Amnibacterium sp. CER49]|uniref:FAD-binding protein n=1 Tax=Amnibacterium sp. CER49 TaxID=3039161 RepID=UPI00244D5701|nr:FAD-binding protein [Amnibacterium sp. CER49]MDH2445411.1 FAD-binding protein [Amnibacterium sp. CER49]
MVDVERELNWAGTYGYLADRIVRVGSVDEARDLVTSGERIRPLGTRHSFNDIADGPGLLVDLTGLPAEVEVAPDRRSATVSAGTRYGLAAVELERQGLALHNMGSLPHISVAGATATATHGSGIGLGALSSAVSAVELLGADGELRTVRRGDPDFDGSVVALGALGLVTRVTVDVQPSYRMRQDAYEDLPWDVFLEHLPEVFVAAYSVCLFTEWDGRVRELLLKSRVPDGAEDIDMPEDILGARRMPPREASDRTTPVDGTVGAWCDRLPHFLISGTPSNGSEIQSEHFVPFAVAAAALDAVAALGDRIRPHLHTAELRTMAADSAWLSPSQGEDVLCIAFTWRKHPEEVAALLPDLEAALAPFGQRPHWGKMSSLDGDAIEALYPRIGGFRDLVRRSDPDGVFRGPFLERIIRP